ncbi:sugar ABC transporter permease [Desulfococcaceae bacterium HSG8]|nr:sugar ABC transporter permease [Desulfococcaceae bacterium HSG8]
MQKAQPPFTNHTGIAFLLLTPSLLILSVFLYYPTIQTFFLSLYQVGFLGLKKKFTGMGNYLTIFSEAHYAHVFSNTLIFVTATVFLSMAVGMSLALLANQKVKGWRVYRILLIWPYALPPAVAGVIFLFLFSSQAGIVNYFLEMIIGIQANWLAQPSLAMTVVVLAAVWKNLGYNVVFYLAALQNLPGDVLEAALIDGAGPWERFWKITFPLLSPMTFFLLVINTIYAFFDVFPFVDLLTKGGPADGTMVIIYSLYRDGFEFFKTGLAAAQSVVLFAVVVGLTIIKFKTYGRTVHYGS